MELKERIAIVRRLVEYWQLPAETVSFMFAWVGFWLDTPRHIAKRVDSLRRSIKDRHLNYLQSIKAGNSISWVSRNRIYAYLVEKDCDSYKLTTLNTKTGEQTSTPISIDDVWFRILIDL